MYVLIVTTLVRPYTLLPMLSPRVAPTRKVVNRMKLVVTATLVVLSTYQTGLVQADDALNSAVIEAFGKYFFRRHRCTSDADFHINLMHWS